MSHAPRCRDYRFALLRVALLALTWPATCAAHVDLTAPNGGETLTGGANFTIQWMPTIAMHDTLNYDLWYSTATASGPWTVIATDVPAGDLSVGSNHAFAWTVPNISAPNAWVRILQDNGSQDYEDVSAGSFAIVAQLLGDFNNNQRVDAADYVIWRNRPTPNPADYALWRANFGHTAATATGVFPAAGVPEPASFRLLSAAAALWHWGLPARGRRQRR